MGVGGVNSTGNSQDVSSSQQVDDTKAANQADRAQLESQLDRQSQGPSSDQMSAFIAQIQAQRMQQEQGASATTTDPLSGVPPDVKSKAQDIAAQVVAQLMSGMPSVQDAGGSSGAGSPSGGGFSEDGGSRASVGSGGGSDMQQAADDQLQQAAKVAVYQDIYNQLQKMQGEQNTKSDLGNAISAMNTQLAGHKSGDQVKVPTYQYDQDSGQVQFTGYKQMDYDQATAMRDSLQNSKDSVADMSQQDMFYLQQAMDKKTQLEEMISNCMKASSDTQNGLAANLKAS